MNEQVQGKNIYQPYLMEIIKVVPETGDTKTFHIQFQEASLRESFSFVAGQFAEYSVFGEGEATFCISSSPTRMSHLEFSVKRVGRVTHALHQLNEGDTIGFRGPYGNHFPLDKLKEKNLLFIGGGIGMAPLRSLIHNVVDTRADYREITILYGARSPQDLCFQYDLESWGGNPSLEMVTTVDVGDDNWKGKVGLVPMVLEEIKPSSKETMAITCGPPIMIRYTLKSLEKLGFTPSQVWTTLEMKMKCGLGKCGRCNIGPLYVCQDGPVFSLEEIKKFTSDEF
ncbi:MAG: FAD/NAD(P)-binding protein [Deltaproteobacteria bacterium]|jgi:NAD(P)H-flavin reductase|nr:FAD/NAD(P)-binding protein [Deltaproteobacteria bacterium]MDO9210079.1 FAD/NAD(P)-binding protein [Deltaproteobacteria bacterium]MDP3040929.1 FAD/NAD(P)-binding protein [Deltaproteobacteria bacterium]